MLILSFFFSSYRHHLLLHSFPTRRSSDLALALGDALAVTLLEVKGFRREDFAALHPGGALGAAPRSPRAGIDRKSTRLNSSHMSISYAVFCLKKKKPNLISPTTKVSQNSR